MDWLCAFGAASPGHVLLPTSDDLASLISEHQTLLSRDFILLDRSPRTIETLLDKRTLIGACLEVGLVVPDTWFPRSEAEAIEIGACVGAPLLLKPRTQVRFASHSKGSMIHDLAALPACFRAFLQDNRYDAESLRRDPDLAYPMLQRLHPSAQTGIYSVSGYCDERGEIVACRASRKILQRPRKLGIGLCFEEAPLDETLVSRIGALCRRVGFRGVFEIEFIDDGAHRLLIDFNPRFYSQLAFDIDRGMPLPLLAYYDAIGDAEQLAATIYDAQPTPSAEPRFYCHRFILEVMLRAQGLSGRLTDGDLGEWRYWLASREGKLTDAVADRGDPAPRLVDVVAHVSHYARHPRAFVRSMVLDL
jgi:predicted ATP-grasp superfamily ATP-dependent carboligase